MGKLQPLLADEEVGTELDVAFQCLALAGRKVATRFQPAHARAEGRFHEQLVEMFEHVCPRRFLPAPPRRDGRQLELFAQQTPAQPGQEPEERRALQQAAARRVGDGDIAGPKGFKQTRNAQHRVVAQFERVAKIVIDTA